MIRSFVFNMLRGIIFFLILLYIYADAVDLYLLWLDLFLFCQC